MKFKLLLFSFVLFAQSAAVHAEQRNIAPLEQKSSVKSYSDVSNLGQVGEVQKLSNRFRVFPIFDSKGAYSGSLTELAHGVYIAAGHVASLINPYSFEDYLKLAFSSNNSATSSQTLKLYQFSGRSELLDAVVFSKFDINYVKDVLAKEFLTNTELQSLIGGGRYEVTSFIAFDRNLVRQKSEGAFFFDLDFNLYLKVDSNGYLNRGSSGALIQTTIAGQSKILSLVECAIQTKQLMSNGDQNETYYRGLSPTSLLSLDLIETNIDDLKIWVKNHRTVGCTPVSGKKGGGT